jgi:hypothetical protein
MPVNSEIVVDLKNIESPAMWSLIVENLTVICTQSHCLY